MGNCMAGMEGDGVTEMRERMAENLAVREKDGQIASGNHAVSAQKKVPGLSQRGEHYRTKLWGALKKISAEQYSPQNPNGHVNLGIAQNSLCEQELVTFFEQNLKLVASDFTYGDDVGGSKRLRAAYAAFLNRYLRPLKPVIGSEHLWAATGVGSVIDGLAFNLAEPGSGVLIAMPYYNAFDFDFTLKSGLVPIGVNVSEYKDPLGPDTLQAFDEQLKRSKKEGIEIKLVVLCNPQNPMGRTYPRSTILAYARFCQEHNLHLISDEIYACSTFKSRDCPDPLPFISILSIDLEKEVGCDPARVHVLHGMSKDFNSNGFRLGFVISQHNPDVIQGLKCSGFFVFPSSPAEALWSALLEDEKFLEDFIAMNQRRLGEAFDYAAGFFRAHGIPYLAANAGHFFLVDLRKHLPARDREGHDDLRARETRLAELFNDERVFVSPGGQYHVQEPGWFRVTFSIQRTTIRVGFQRIEKALGLHSRQDVWDAGAAEAGAGQMYNGVGQSDVPPTRPL